MGYGKYGIAHGAESMARRKGAGIRGPENPFEPITDYVTRVADFQ